VGLAGAGAGVLTASGFQSTGLQVPAGESGWQTWSRERVSGQYSGNLSQILINSSRVGTTVPTPITLD